MSPKSVVLYMQIITTSLSSCERTWLLSLIYEDMISTNDGSECGWSYWWFVKVYLTKMCLPGDYGHQPYRHPGPSAAPAGTYRPQDRVPGTKWRGSVRYPQGKLVWSFRWLSLCVLFILVYVHIFLARGLLNHSCREWKRGKFYIVPESMGDRVKVWRPHEFEVVVWLS